MSKQLMIVYYIIVNILQTYLKQNEIYLLFSIQNMLMHIRTNTS